jgi:hypothetical protein
MRKIVELSNKALLVKRFVSINSVLLALIVAGTAFAQQHGPQAITRINSKVVYVYNEDGEEAEPNTRKAKDFTRHFADLGLAGLDQQGLRIAEVNSDEGLIAVQLPGEDELVWIELIAVEVWPGNKLDCPEAVLGKAKETDQGVTIGFGDHCK